MAHYFWEPVKLSLEVASVSIIIVFFTGIIFARLMTRVQFKGKIIVETLFMLPLVLPPTVVGFLLVIIFGNNSPIGIFIESLFNKQLMFTWWAAVIASTIVAFPLMYQSAKAGFLNVDRDIEEAARIDGASEFKVFIYITVPAAMRAIVSGIILSFARALGEFGATLMFAGNIPGKTQTTPTAIYVALDSGNIQLAWLWVISILIISFFMLLMTSMLK
ncbi:molybdate ABC transporter permease subunit [Bacillus aquiflavi]|uniref:Molybdenum transport system permease n=1 Tax=Bacillus aquiflavi TaxID=2672567 RepID=A0A6B3W3D2_9BACI|nr:molybdate ABC transporter permease subunit [Bacillus aquiflavi]MBA4538647.1 molybdate ABC transporter permease subunit [Bacillus aquiflavi]NEY83007.1 molybdate ABC transporter permease subunit [Bacillus aquiflavi]UAC49582.1 molybdate ABC transporter permease subunit [Bacillus aquiflavi]